MEKDYRSEPMESKEGRGLARRAWDSYYSTVTKASEPLLHHLASRVSARIVNDMMGFWLCWHLEGGFEGMERMGMDRATIYRKIARFRKYMKVHPDEYQMPGVTLDPAEYLKAQGGSNE